MKENDMSDLVVKEETALQRREPWLRSWQWATGLLPPLWGLWVVIEFIRRIRGQSSLVTGPQARRINFLQLLPTTLIALTGGTWLVVVMLWYLVLLAPTFVPRYEKEKEGS